MVLSGISLFYAVTCQPPPFFHLPKAGERAGQHQPNLSVAGSPKGMRFPETDAAPWSVSPRSGHLRLFQGIFLLASRDRRKKKEDGNRGLPQGGWERGLWWAQEAGGGCFNGRSQGGEVTRLFFFLILKFLVK